MPSIYTASKLNTNRIQAPAFTKKGIDGLTTGRLSELHHVGIAVEKQPAYEQYIHNLPAFMHATAVQSKVSCHLPGYDMKLAPDLIIPIPLPPLTIASNRPFKNEEDKVAFKQSVPEVLEEHRNMKGLAFTIRNPTFEVLTKLPLKAIDPNVPSPVDATSLLGLSSFNLTLRIISLFLSTHTYPYKQSPEDDGQQFGKDIAIGWPQGKRFYVRGSTLRGDPEPGTKEDHMGSEDKVFGLADADIPSSYVSGQYAVNVAKPAPLRPSIGYGTPQSLPAFPGYLLPYFRGIIDPSKDVIISVIRRFFLSAVVGSKAGRNEAWSSWIKGVDRWYQTESGKIVAHILFNIQTALEAQARLYVIMVGKEYLGCAILGYGSGIVVGDVVKAPDTSVELRKLAMALDDHSTALTRVVEIINEARGEGEMEVEVSQITKARKLYGLIKETEEFSSTQMEEIIDLMGKLTFNEPYRPASHVNITKAITLILDTTADISDLPMYLDGTNLSKTSRAYEVLSSFGPLAPSLLDAAGQDIPIPKGLLADDPATTPDADGNVQLSKLLVSLKKLPVAVTDWTNVVKKRRIRQNVGKRDAGFRTIEVRNEGFVAMWGALKGIPFSADGKRKRESAEDGDEDMEEPVEKRGKKSMTTSVEFSLDDLF
jgi:hypothetical protein